MPLHHRKNLSAKFVDTSLIGADSVARGCGFFMSASAYFESSQADAVWSDDISSRWLASKRERVSRRNARREAIEHENNWETHRWDYITILRDLLMIVYLVVIAKYTHLYFGVMNKI